MKSFLLILLTIAVHHTIQYEKTEEIKLINTEIPPEKHEEKSHNLRKGDVKNLTNIKDSVKIDLEQNNYRELRDEEKVSARRWLNMYKIMKWVNQLFAKTVKGKPSHPRPRGMIRTKKPKGSRNSRKPKHKKTREDSIGSIDIDDNNPESFESIFNKKDSDEEEILLRHKTAYRNVDEPMIFIIPARE